MPDFPPPRLSQLLIDIAKDWGAYRILNIGVPITVGDVLRKGTRLTAVEMLDGGSEQVLTGQGAGINPQYADPKIRNLAKGITPTATGWTTPPTSLGNATDEVMTTVTGEGTGQAVTVETNNVNELTVNLGAVQRQPLVVFIKLGIRSSYTGTLSYCACRVGGLDTLSDPQVGATVSHTETTEAIRYILGCIVTAPTVAIYPRYLSLRAWNAVATRYPLVKFYEIIIVGLALS